MLAASSHKTTQSTNRLAQVRPNALPTSAWISSAVFHWAAQSLPPPFDVWILKGLEYCSRDMLMYYLGLIQIL